jgi:MSHA pilin protein MshA
MHQKKALKPINSQQGFSLIELVVVIVVLGVFSATALPKFVDLSSDARISSLKYFAGVLKKAVYLVYAKQQIENDVSGDDGEGINLYGTFIQTSYGFIDGGSANDFLSVLEGDVAIATNLSEPCKIQVSA